ncbi:MAG: hypothetical protein WC734_00795 [Patescibacteria group bacterium]|jgi:hypothetical protein
MTFVQMCLKAANTIAFCDFRVRVLLLGIGDTPPVLKCVIRVGENHWFRYLVVTSTEVTDNPTLAVLATSQNKKPIEEVKLGRPAQVITLNDLVAGSYVGIRRMLNADEIEASVRTRGSR